MTQVAYELPTANGAFRAARVAFVHSLWHADIVTESYVGFADEMAKLGFRSEAIERFELPGVFEIPLHAKLLARTGRFAAVVAAGLVVDGGIYRHDFVASTVVQALMQVQLETDTPVFSVVLTPHHFHEHETHRRFFRDHFRIKGAEAAQACAQTLASLGRMQAA
jgi:6,7-dimethyl-8-ribityllumazine synthase